MCGIAGWYRRCGRPVARESFVTQCDRIVHRGPDDSGDLVDGDFGLFVAGSSVFSTSGWANTTLTLVALALRLADHLDGRLKDRPSVSRARRAGTPLASSGQR